MASVYFFGHDPFIYHKEHKPNALDRMGSCLTAPTQFLHRKLYPIQKEPDAKSYLNPHGKSSKAVEKHPFLFAAVYIGSFILPLIDLIGCLFRSIALVGKETLQNRTYLIERYDAKWKLDRACKKVESAYRLFDLSEDFYFKCSTFESFKEQKEKSIFKDEKQLKRKSDLILSKLKTFEDQKERALKLEQLQQEWGKLTSEQHDKVLKKQETQDLIAEGLKAQQLFMEKVPPEDKETSFRELKKKYKDLWEQYKPGKNAEEIKKFEQIYREFALSLHEASLFILKQADESYGQARTRLEDLLKLKA